MPSPTRPRALILLIAAFLLTGAPATAGRAGRRHHDAARAERSQPAPVGNPAPRPLPAPQQGVNRRLGDAYYARGGFWGAYENYKRLADTGQADPIVLYRLGYSAQQLRRTEEAKTWFGKAAEAYEARTEGADPHMEDFYYLASSRNNLADSEGTREAASRGIAFHQKSTGRSQPRGEELFQLSRLYTLLGRGEEAQKATDEAIAAYRNQPQIDANDQGYATLMLEKAREDMATGQNADAASVYEEILRRKPGTPGAGYELGIAWLRTGDDEKALAAWEAAKGKDPARSTDAGYAAGLMRRIVTHAREYPDAPRVEVEAPYASMDRAALEGEISGALGRLQEAMRKAQDAGPVAGKTATLQGSLAKADVDAAQAKLAAALLAYHLRGLPTRELANQLGLVGWIFRKE